MLRAVVLVTTALAVQASAASGAHESRSVPRGTATSMSVTGEIQALGPSRISVGRLGCSIPGTLAVSAGRFVIGDPVRISCLNGALRSVRYSPELAPAQSDRPGGGNAPATASTPVPVPPFDPSTAKAIAYSFGAIFLGGGPTGETDTATGPISELSDGSVTAGGLTCSYRPGLTSFFGRVALVGDDVTLTCTGGTLVHLASVGTVSHSG